MEINNQTMVDFIYKAYNAEFGIECYCTDIDAFKRLFYKTRAKLKKEGYEEFSNLVLYKSSEGENLIRIVKKERKV